MIGQAEQAHHANNEKQGVPRLLGIRKTVFEK